MRATGWIRLAIALCPLGLAAASPVSDPSPQASAWRVDDTRSEATFEVRALAFIPVQGTFVGLTGAVTRAGEDGRVTVVVPVDGLRMRSKSRRDWALSDEFFHVAAHPQIRFEAALDTEAMLAALGAGHAFDVSGELTLRGKALPQAFQVTHSSCAFDAAAACDIELTGVISRKRFGMAAHSFTLADAVSMTIRLSLSRTPP